MADGDAVNSLGFALRVFAYMLVANYVARGIALTAAPSWPYHLAGYALTGAAVLLAAHRASALERAAPAHNPGARVVATGGGR